MGEDLAHVAKPKHTLEEVLKATEQGITKTGTARLLGVTRETVRNYCKRWVTVERAFQEKRAELVDLSEMGLRGAVLRGEPWAIAFALRTLGKDEGYTERHEVTGKDGNAIELQVVERVVTRRDADAGAA